MNLSNVYLDLLKTDRKEIEIKFSEIKCSRFNLINKFENKHFLSFALYLILGVLA